jgi:hypothetical protein
LPGLSNNTLSRNDDGSTGAVSIGFAINYYGTSDTELFVNNNGNLTFGSGMGTYTPYAINDNARAIIAPFFADVDTRGAGSNIVTYGNDVLDGRQVFGANYIDVGYYGAHSDKLNSFQVLLVDRSDTGAGNFDIEFNYDKTEWETGDASSGSGGLGGVSARAGWSSGPTNNPTFYEFPGSGINGALLDGGPNALTSGSFGSTEPGRYYFQVRNGTTAEPGTEETNPILPSTTDANGTFFFSNVPSGRWFDPPLVFGYEFTMSRPGSLFTEIMNFPSGPSFGNLTVTAGGNTWTGQQSGMSLNLGGVTSFRITGISPLLDNPNGAAFPIQLAFSTPTAAFSMTPLASNVPEPGTVALSLTGLAAVMWLRRRRR